MVLLRQAVKSLSRGRVAYVISKPSFKFEGQISGESQSGVYEQNYGPGGPSSKDGMWVLARGFVMESSKRLHTGALVMNQTPSSEQAGGSLANQEARRIVLNRLLYRSRQRGYLELDLLLGKWAERNVEKLDDISMAALVELLDEENPDLWKWITGQMDPPPAMASNPVFLAVYKEVAESLEVHSDPQTRATPGAAWVRGWDDRDKRQPWSTPSGNQ